MTNNTLLCTPVKHPGHTYRASPKKKLPHVDFHLFYPKTLGIKKTDWNKLHHRFFTSKPASENVSTENLICVCDIRRTRGTRSENGVWEGMLAQQQWHEIISPELTTVLFRLPVGGARGKPLRLCALY